MTVQEFAAQLRDIIKGLKDDGTETISSDNLIAYLDDIASSTVNQPSDAQLAQYQAELQLHIEQSKNQHSAQLEMFRSVITAGQNAIRTSFLLNGGGVVALVAFVSHLTQVQPDKVVVFATALLPFVTGVLAMAMTSGFTYLSQWLYDSMSEKVRKTGFVLNILCIVLGLLSYVFFAVGIYWCYQGFNEFV